MASSIEPIMSNSIACGKIVDDIPAPLIICGLQIPSELTSRAYTPEVIEDYDTEADSRKYKFGGHYTVQTPELKHWPVCHLCSKPLSLMFQTESPALNVDQVEDDDDDEQDASEIPDNTEEEAVETDDSPKTDIQFLMCIDTDCSGDECSVCNSEGPCFKLIKCDLEDPDLTTIAVPNPLPCFPILCWNVILEPTNIKAVIEWIQAHLDMDDSTKLHIGLITDEDAVFEEVAKAVNDGFKFGGCPASTQGIDTYSNYLQLGEESYFPYMWGDCGILHVDADGASMKGDMC